MPSITEAPPVWVRCKECGWRLAKWQLASTGHVLPIVRASGSTQPGWDGIPWLDRANAGKGPIAIGKAAGGDGKATQNYRCPKCTTVRKKRNVPVSAARRLELYLLALLANRTDTYI